MARWTQVVKTHDVEGANEPDEVQGQDISRQLALDVDERQRFALGEHFRAEAFVPVLAVAQRDLPFCKSVLLLFAGMRASGPMAAALLPTRLHTAAHPSA
eukprot:5699380-Prymnesium_polylepis.1